MFANNTYARARLKLSILYTIIFGSLILVLSVILFHFFAADIHEDMASIYPDKSVQVRIINQHKTPLRNLLISLDAVILLFIACVSFVLADATLRPIQRNDEAQRRFIAKASHELRTPIAILKTDIQVYLSDKSFTTVVRPILRGYLEEVDRMAIIVENLLTLFRFESHQEKFAKEKILLDALVLKSSGKMESYAKANRISIQKNIMKNIPVLGNTFFLEQAVRNILKNAIEYSDKSGKIQVSLIKKNHLALVVICDNGIGIAKDHIDHIYDSFNRSKEAIKKRKEGLGLGLPIARQIIQLHGGTLVLTSRIGQGTTATISLPLHRS